MVGRRRHPCGALPPRCLWLVLSGLSGKQGGRAINPKTSRGEVIEVTHGSGAGLPRFMAPQRPASTSARGQLPTIACFQLNQEPGSHGSARCPRGAPHKSTGAGLGGRLGCAEGPRGQCCWCSLRPIARRPLSRGCVLLRTASGLRIAQLPPTMRTHSTPRPAAQVWVWLWF